MKKMGNFRGLPVYLANGMEFIDADHSAECLYVNDNTVYYLSRIVGELYNGKLVNFDEDRFNALRRKDWSTNDAESLGRVTNSAEVRPQEEEKPVNETVETDCRIVDDFMSSWCENIDKEIDMLKNNIAKMEASLNEVV